MAPGTLSQISTQTRIKTTTKTVKKQKKGQKLFIRPVRHVGRQTTPPRNATLEPMQPIDRMPGTEDREDKMSSKREPAKMTQMKLLRLQLKIKNENATSSLRSCD